MRRNGGTPRADRSCGTSDEPFRAVRTPGLSTARRSETLIVAFSPHAGKECRSDSRSPSNGDRRSSAITTVVRYAYRQSRLKTVVRGYIGGIQPSP